jgi:hypothetical protein
MVVNMNTTQLKQGKGGKNAETGRKNEELLILQYSCEWFPYRSQERSGVKGVGIHVQQETALEGNMEPICILPWELSI